MSTDPPTATSDHESFDADAARRAIQEGTRAGHGFSASPTVLFLTWGAAWLVGDLTLWFSAGATASPGDPSYGLVPLWAFAVFVAGFLIAGIATAIHLRESGRGIRGRTTSIGWKVGATFASITLIVFLVLFGLDRLGLSPSAQATLSTALPSAAVGLAYVAGGLAFQVREWWALGIWLSAINAVAIAVGVPGTYLMIGLAGGAGFFVAAVLVTRARRDQS